MPALLAAAALGEQSSQMLEGLWPSSRGGTHAIETDRSHAVHFAERLISRPDSSFCRRPLTRTATCYSGQEARHDHANS